MISDGEGIGERLQAFAQEKGITPPDVGDESGGRPEIQITKDLGKLAVEAAPVFARLPIFQRDGVAVIVNEVKESLEVVTPHGFRSFADRHVRFYKTAKRQVGDDIEFVKAYQSLIVDQAFYLLSDSGFVGALRPLRRLNRIRKPVMRGGAAVLLPAGYDPIAQVWTVDGVPDYEIKPVEQVKAEVYHFLRDFSWPTEAGEGERSIAALMAGFHAGFCADLVGRGKRSPIFVCQANAPGGGKTLLSILMSGVLSGRINVKAMPKDNDKLREMLNSQVLGARESLLIDNLMGYVNHEELAMFATTPQIEDRRFRTQEDFSVENLVTVFLSGNGVAFEIGPDLSRRCVFIDLFEEEADLGAKIIEEPMEPSWCQDVGNRRQVLSWLWSMVKHWSDQAEADRAKPSRLINSFEGWSAVVGSIVMSAGFGDPLRKSSAQRVGNKSERDVQDLIEALLGEGATSATFPQIVHVCSTLGLFDWVVPPAESPDVDAVTGEVRFDLDDCDDRSGLDRGPQASFGKHLKRLAPPEGQIYTVEHAGEKRRVRFSIAGANRGRRYLLEMI